MTRTEDKTRSGRVVRKINFLEDSDSDGSEEDVARDKSNSKEITATSRRDLTGDSEEEPMDMKSDSEELSSFEDDDVGLPHLPRTKPTDNNNTLGQLFRHFRKFSRTRPSSQLNRNPAHPRARLTTA